MYKLCLCSNLDFVLVNYGMIVIFHTLCRPKSVHFWWTCPAKKEIDLLAELINKIRAYGHIIQKVLHP